MEAIKWPGSEWEMKKAKGLEKVLKEKPRGYRGPE